MDAVSLIDIRTYILEGMVVQQRNKQTVGAAAYQRTWKYYNRFEHPSLRYTYNAGAPPCPFQAALTPMGCPRFFSFQETTD